MITIKVPESRLKWIKDEYKLAKWGVNGLFEYGGCLLYTSDAADE